MRRKEGREGKSELGLGNRRYRGKRRRKRVGTDIGKVLNEKTRGQYSSMGLEEK